MTTLVPITSDRPIKIARKVMICYQAFRGGFLAAIDIAKMYPPEDWEWWDSADAGYSINDNYYKPHSIYHTPGVMARAPGCYPGCSIREPDGR